MDKPVVLIPKSFPEGSIFADKFVISAEPVMTDDTTYLAPWMDKIM